MATILTIGGLQVKGNRHRYDKAGIWKHVAKSKSWIAGLIASYGTERPAAKAHEAGQGKMVRSMLSMIRFVRLCGPRG